VAGGRPPTALGGAVCGRCEGAAASAVPAATIGGGLGQAELLLGRLAGLGSQLVHKAAGLVDRQCVAAGLG
jgi:hypothetical protein